MNYWLIKSEPDVWSFSQQKKLEKKVSLGMVFGIIKLQTI